jgi:3-oxoacyl-(acyl-carrier-protein) synthase
LDNDMRIARIGSAFSRAFIETGDLACRHPRAGRLDRYCRLAVSAAEALIASPVLDPALGIFIASQFACFGANAEHWKILSEGAPASPLIFPATAPSAAAGEIATAILAMGPNVTLVGSAAEIWQTARSAIAAGDCTQAICGVVEAWHPRLTELGASWQTHDGACLALISASDPALTFAVAPSALLSFSGALASNGPVNTRGV